MSSGRDRAHAKIDRFVANKPPLSEWTEVDIHSFVASLSPQFKPFAKQIWITGESLIDCTDKNKIHEEIEIICRRMNLRPFERTVPLPKEVRRRSNLEVAGSLRQTGKVFTD